MSHREPGRYAALLHERSHFRDYSGLAIFQTKQVVREIVGSVPLELSLEAHTVFERFVFALTPFVIDAPELLRCATAKIEC